MCVSLFSRQIDFALCCCDLCAMFRGCHLRGVVLYGVWVCMSCVIVFWTCRQSTMKMLQVLTFATLEDSEANMDYTNHLYIPYVHVCVCVCVCVHLTLGLDLGTMVVEGGKRVPRLELLLISHKNWNEATLLSLSHKWASCLARPDFDAWPLPANLICWYPPTLQIDFDYFGRSGSQWGLFTHC